MPNTCEWVHTPNVDGQTTVQGVLGYNVTMWELSDDIDDSDIDVAILGPAFGANVGKVIPVVNIDGKTAVADGDFTKGCVILGRSYQFKVELSRVYVRDNNNNAMVNGRTHLRRLSLQHSNTGEYDLRMKQGTRTDRVTEFSVANQEFVEEGQLATHVLAPANDVTLTIENSSPRPTTITAVMHEADFAPWGV